MRTLAVIPARGGSKRLPGKNIRPLHGKPLIHWSIEFARTVDWFSCIEVSTDDAAIAQCCVDVGQPVCRLRPAALATDTATSLDVALDMLDWKASQGEHFDLLALLQPTTPVRNRAYWDQALCLIRDGRHDAAIGVGPAASHPHLTFKILHEQRLQPWIAERPTSLRTQDLEPAWVVNGALYLIRVDALRAERSFMPRTTVGVPMSAPLENLDIDTELDWLVAEQAIRNFKSRQ